MNYDESVLLVASKDWPWPDGGSGTTPPGGLVRFCRDAASGLLGPVMDVSAVGAPSYLAYNRGLSSLYATSDFSDSGTGTPGRGDRGAVTAFRVEPSGRLEFVNSQVAEGWVPCHLAVHQAQRHVLSADYGDGAVTVYPLRPDGSVGPASHVVRNRGEGPNPERQAGPHAHMVKPVQGTEWILTTDLGTDEVLAYTLDTELGQLRPRPGPPARVRPGSGPRHLEVHPSGTMFVVNELQSSVTVFSYDVSSGEMTETAEVRTVAGDDGGNGNAPSGLVLSPDARFLYVGNRGRDSIAVLRVESRGLTLIAEVAAGGDPRDLVFVDDHLYVANLASGTVSVFGWDPLSGSLGLRLQVVEVPSPSCVLGL
jgi:6-phosphogluconolactonase